MKEFLKNALKRIGLYHPLQSAYREMIFQHRLKKNRREYRGFAGSGFTCNICGSSYSKFVPDLPGECDRPALEKNGVIAGYGENVFCPNCMSTARERLVVAFLQDRMAVEGKKILQVAPEKNIYRFLAEKATVTTADLQPGFYKNIDKGILREDALGFTFDTGSFDIVIANHVLEHIPQDKAAMREFLRILKPGGLAILQVPYSDILESTFEEPAVNDPSRQSALFGQKDHVRIYSAGDYVHRLREAGFIVEVLNENELLPYLKFATQPREKFFKIHKPVV